MSFRTLVPSSYLCYLHSPLYHITIWFAMLFSLILSKYVRFRTSSAVKKRNQNLFSVVCRNVSYPTHTHTAFFWSTYLNSVYLSPLFNRMGCLTREKMKRKWEANLTLTASCDTSFAWKHILSERCFEQVPATQPWKTAKSTHALGHIYLLVVEESDAFAKTEGPWKPLGKVPVGRQEITENCSSWEPALRESCFQDPYGIEQN